MVFSFFTDLIPRFYLTYSDGEEERRHDVCSTKRFARLLGYLFVCLSMKTCEMRQSRTWSKTDLSSAFCVLTPNARCKHV